jgi:hypothetical protein
MHRGIEPPLAPALGRLAITRILFDMRDHPRIEDRLAIRLRIAPAIHVEIRALKIQTCQLGYSLQGLHPFGSQHRIRCIDRRHRQGSQHRAVVDNDRNALFSLLVFVAGIADAVPAFFGDGVGAIAMQDAEIELVVLCQMPHTGDEGMLKGAVIRPPGEDFVDGRLVDGWLTLGVLREGQALPLHPCIEHREDEVEDAVRAEFTFWPTLGHREVREEKFRELRGGELNRNRRRCWFCWRCRHDELASYEDR